MASNTYAEMLNTVFIDLLSIITTTRLNFSQWTRTLNAKHDPLERIRVARPKKVTYRCQCQQYCLTNKVYEF